MPIHEFHCRECSADFELLLKEKNPAPQCPQCGSANVEKKMSSFGSMLRKGKDYFSQCSPSS